MIYLLWGFLCVYRIHSGTCDLAEISSSSKKHVGGQAAFSGKSSQYLLSLTNIADGALYDTVPRWSCALVPLGTTVTATITHVFLGVR